MLLKRHYRKPQAWQPDRNVRDANGKLKAPTRPENELLNQPPIDHFTVVHTGTHAEQNFSTRMIERGVAEGWATVGEGKLTLKCDPEALVYAIKRGPGFYCCHCARRLEDASSSAAHVAAEHEGKKSPDASNPAGYSRINQYECVLAPQLHAKHRVGAPKGA